MMLLRAMAKRDNFKHPSMAQSECRSFTKFYDPKTRRRRRKHCESEEFQQHKTQLQAAREILVLLEINLCCCEITVVLREIVSRSHHLTLFLIVAASQGRLTTHPLESCQNANFYHCQLSLLSSAPNTHDRIESEFNFTFICCEKNTRRVESRT